MLNHGVRTSEVSKVGGVEAALTPDLTWMAVYRLALRQGERGCESLIRAKHRVGGGGGGVGEGQTCHIYCLS